MKLIAKRNLNNYKKINLDFYEKKDDQSHKMFADKISKDILHNLNKLSYINLDELISKTNTKIAILVLRILSFSKEKLMIKKDNKNFEINIFSEDIERSEKVITIINTISKTRELQDTPQNILTPNNFKKIIIETFGSWVTIPNESEMQQLRLFNAVGNSSIHKPEFVIIKNLPIENEDPILLIGKGITYDSGGYNLKSAKNLLGMKADMSGAAIIFGVMKLLKHFNIQKNVIAILPLANNLIGNESMLPQMVFKSFDDTNVEIKNTDAEGRLVNADAISYSKYKFNPKLILEVSTLTGSITQTISNLATGIFSNSFELAANFIEYSKNTLERFVYFERFEELKYRLYNSSSIADIANVDMNAKMGPQYAFEFLNHFAKKTPFIHLDVAGTAVWNRDRGTGETVHSIFEFVKRS